MTLKVWANDVTDWVIAESAADARVVMNEHIGPGYPGEDDDQIAPEDEWTPEPDDKTLEIRTDDGRGVVKKTCAEWVAESGRGFLASTEY